MESGLAPSAVLLDLLEDLTAVDFDEAQTLQCGENCRPESKGVSQSDLDHLPRLVARGLVRWALKGKAQ